MMNISGITVISGVIGYNIRYTKSPIIHNYWYDILKIDGVYVCFNTISTDFSKSINGLFEAGIIGVNVTVPFKEIAFKSLKKVSSTAEKSGSVNCIFLKNNELYGEDTDGLGLYNSLFQLIDNFDISGKRFLILGAGGAAKSIISFLSDYNVHISILNRTFEKAKLIADIFSNDKAIVVAVKKHIDCDIVINTTSLKEIEAGSILDIPENNLKSTTLFYDINYGLIGNNLRARLYEYSIKYTDGLEMLLNQAAPSFGLINNTETPPINEKLRKLILNNIQT